jgi:RimJ/RimL family protein N-acetyltransferase
MLPIGPVTLGDAIVRLEPMSTEHIGGLHEAAARDRSTFGLTLVPSSLEAWGRYLASFLGDQARGTSVPLTTFDARANRIVGSTRFMTIERWKWSDEGNPLQRSPEYADALEIGSTWLAKDAQRTTINTHAKLLMLTQAFEAWEVRRVMLKTDARNVRSRTAIERLGAKFDGVLRAHMPAFDGGVRDTAFYSILASEWPAVKKGLEARA